MPIPDLMRRRPPRVAIKSIRWADGAATLARTLPDSRTVFILRHPCGQVASVMRGNRQRRFDLKTDGTDMPFDEATTLPFAAGHAVDGPAFQALPDAAKYAWSWRAFNEPAYAALAAQPNVHVVLYEALVRAAQRRRAPHPGVRRPRLERARPQISSPAAPPTRAKPATMRIFRDAVAAAEAWRKTMPPADQEAVRAVVAASPLARFWPDLASLG